MTKRPISVTIISGLLVLNAAIGLFTVLSLFTRQSSTTANDLISQSTALTTADFVISFIGVAVFFASAVGLFFKQGWMRFVLIGWVVFVLLHALLAQHLTVYVVVRELVFVGIISIFLFSAKENAWFAGTDTPTAAG